MPGPGANFVDVTGGVGYRKTDPGAFFIAPGAAVPAILPLLLITEVGVPSGEAGEAVAGPTHTHTYYSRHVFEDRVTLLSELASSLIRR